jgi:hypothetical protein
MNLFSTRLGRFIVVKQIQLSRTNVSRKCHEI